MTSHQAEPRYSRPWLQQAPPQLGVGGCTPRPRKPSEDSTPTSSRELEARDHQRGSDHVGGDVAEEDAAAAGAQGHRHRHELARLHGQHRDAHELGVDHPAPQHQHDHQVGEAELEVAPDEGDGEEQVRQRKSCASTASMMVASTRPPAQPLTRPRVTPMVAAMRTEPSASSRKRCAPYAMRLSTSRPKRVGPEWIAPGAAGPRRGWQGLAGRGPGRRAARGRSRRGERGHRQRDQQDHAHASGQPAQARARRGAGRTGALAAGPGAAAAPISTPARSPPSRTAIASGPWQPRGRARCRAGRAAGSPR